MLNNLQNIPVIIIFDPRGIFSKGNLDVIKRHKEYGKILSKLSPQVNTKLVVFSTYSSCKIIGVNTDYFNFFQISNPTINSFSFARKALSLIKNKSWDVKLIIASDPWESFWASYFFKHFFRIIAPIQMQIHGDIGDKTWKKINFRNRLRFSLAKLSIPRADSYRLVSKTQAKNLQKSFKIEPNLIDVIPVPIKVYSKKQIKYDNNSRPFSLALVGRIHPDRGIWDFVTLIKKLNQVSISFKVIIIGSNNSKVSKKFTLELKSLLPANRLIILNNLPQKDLFRHWKNIGTLVSLAPVESYGRAMREALIHGVPVWATKSSGSLELQKHFTGGQFKYLNLNKNPTKLLYDLNLLNKSKVNLKSIDQFIVKNENFSANLVKSWLRIINTCI